MIELWGTTVTWGTIVLALAIASVAVWAVTRHARVLFAGALAILAVHAVAYWTDVLELGALASARAMLAEAAIAGFLYAAGALDTAFAMARSGLAWLYESLAETGVPGAEGSALEFLAVLLVVVAASAAVSAVLIGIRRWAGDSPLGGLLASMGVVFGALGVLWTWFPVAVADLNALYVVLLVCAIAAGYALSATLAGASLGEQVGSPRTGR
ncbi:MAG: hypothetical protein QXG03_05015 [Halalkalicoccus sp.]